MNLIEQLNWRHACKAMNGEKVSEEKVNSILEATRLAPTSSGLQPFEVFVITNQDLKEKIKAIAHGQTMVADCSHLLVFAAWDTYTAARINHMFDLTNKERGGTNEGWENYRNYLLSAYPNKSAEENFIHTAKQAYIGLGFALAAAALENVDSTPMEGFDANGLDELRGLKEKGLRSVVLLPLGYRDAAKDWLAPLKKIRKSNEEFITVIK